MGKKDKKTKGKRKSEKKAASYDLAEFEIFDTPTEMMEIGDAPITNDDDLSSATTNSKIDQQEQTNNEQQQEQQEQEVVEQEEVEEPKPKKPKLLQSERRALRAQRQLEKGVKTSMLDEEKTFSSFGVDNRIVLAIQKLKFTQPTLVQSAAIPLALRGKNILARAKTGTGKTAAYTIPIVNHILTAKQNDTEAKIRALILVPTVELCEQVKLHLDQLTFYCAKEVSSFVLKKKDLKADIPRLQEKPDVIVSTPGKIAAHLNSGSVQLKDSLEILVLDESDLLLSYGFEADIKAIINEIPKICQTFLMSATFSEEVEELKKLVLHNPVILKLHDAEETHGGNLSQFYINCPLPHDKYLYLYAMLKFNVTRGKTIIFVNDIDRAYRLKLFLAMFYINSAVLNSELPQNTRYHVVQEFNNEKFQYLIATEEGLRDDQDIKKEIKEEENSDEVKETKKQKKRKRKTEDQDFGVSRGIDFQKVAAVINFDMCDSVTSYLHRIGRTARAGSDGVAVSLIRHEEEQAIFTKIAKHQTKRGKEIKEYKFMDKEELSNFKYRVEDVMANITGKKIKTLRANEIKSEMLNSEKLKTYFLQNPNDLQALKHVRKNVKQRRSHLKDIPSYLQPKSSVKAPIQVNVKSKYNVAPTKSSNTNQGANNKKKTASTSKQPKKRPRMDPLDTFKY